MSFTVEKDWTTAAGLRAVVVMTSMGHHCGYVGVQKGHPLHGVNYSAQTAALAAPSEDEPVGKRGPLAVLCAALAPEDGGRMQSPEMVFDVHGSLTYSGGSETYPAPSDGLWWFGYDCGHAWDRPSDEACEAKRARYPDMPLMWDDCDADRQFRDLPYCVNECESLARQIVEKTREAA